MESYFTDKAVLFLERSDFNDKGEFLHDLGKKPMVVMMGGTFCPHCTAAAPMFDDFAKSNKNVVAAVIQVDGSSEEQQLGAHLSQVLSGVGRGVPMFLLFKQKGGKEAVFIKTHEGARKKEALVEFAQSA
jgi:thiol-disulfide isomerase/thioredoxin